MDISYYSGYDFLSALRTAERNHTPISKILLIKNRLATNTSRLGQVAQIVARLFQTILFFTFRVESRLTRLLGVPIGATVLPLGPANIYLNEDLSKQSVNITLAGSGEAECRTINVTRVRDNYYSCTIPDQCSEEVATVLFQIAFEGLHSSHPITVVCDCPEDMNGYTISDKYSGEDLSSRRFELRERTTPIITQNHILTTQLNLFR